MHNNVILARLRKEFAFKRILEVAMLPNPGDTVESLRRHLIFSPMGPTNCNFRSVRTIQLVSLRDWTGHSEAKEPQTRALPGLILDPLQSGLSTCCSWRSSCPKWSHLVFLPACLSGASPSERPRFSPTANGLD